MYETMILCHLLNKNVYLYKVMYRSHIKRDEYWRRCFLWLLWPHFSHHSQQRDNYLCLWCVFPHLFSIRFNPCWR